MFDIDAPAHTTTSDGMSQEDRRRGVTSHDEKQPIDLTCKRQPRSQADNDFFGLSKLILGARLDCVKFWGSWELFGLY